jgi:hypothetical protein
VRHCRRSSPAGEDLPWSYVYLIAITPTDGGLDLSCGEEPDRPEFVVHCPWQQRIALDPYFEIFTAWRMDPGGVECPLIPIHRERLGQPTLSLQGAQHDFPESEVLKKPSIHAASRVASQETRRIVHVSVDVSDRPL